MVPLVSSSLWRLGAIIVSSSLRKYYEWPPANSKVTTILAPLRMEPNRESFASNWQPVLLLHDHEFGKSWKVYSMNITVADVQKLFSLDADGTSRWKTGITKAGVLRQWIGDIMLSHVVLAFDQPFIYKLPMFNQKKGKQSWPRTTQLLLVSKDIVWLELTDAVPPSSVALTWQTWSY